MQARITGIGSYIPPRIMTNADIEKMVETTDDWIFSRTGIRERRIASESETPSMMGKEAAKIALDRAGLTPNDIDLIVVATMSPDYPTPSTACLIQAQLKAENAAALDIGAACSGYIYGLSVSKAWVESGMYKNVLFIATEKMSSIVDFTDRSTCILFGDGASAAVISNNGKGYAIEDVALGANGCGEDLIKVPAGGSANPISEETLAKRMQYIQMQGREVFKLAVRQMSASVEECLKRQGLTYSEIDWLVPHQANGRIIDAMGRAMELPEEKVYRTVEKYANTSAASIGTALDELCERHPLKIGTRIVLAAFGAGLTWGVALLKKVEE